MGPGLGPGPAGVGAGRELSLSCHPVTGCLACPLANPCAKALAPDALPPCRLSCPFHALVELTCMWVLATQRRLPAPTSRLTPALVLWGGRVPSCPTARQRLSVLWTPLATCLLPAPWNLREWVSGSQGAASSLLPKARSHLALSSPCDATGPGRSPATPRPLISHTARSPCCARWQNSVSGPGQGLGASLADHRGPSQAAVQVA